MLKTFPPNEHVDRGVIRSFVILVVGQGHICLEVKADLRTLSTQLLPSCLTTTAPNTSCYKIFFVCHFNLTNHGIFVCLVLRGLAPSVQHFILDMPCVSYTVNFLLMKLVPTPRISSSWKYALPIALTAFTRNLSLNTPGRNGK